MVEKAVLVKEAQVKVSIAPSVEKQTEQTMLDHMRLMQLRVRSHWQILGQSRDISMLMETAIISALLTHRVVNALSTQGCTQ